MSDYSTAGALLHAGTTGHGALEHSIDFRYAATGRTAPEQDRSTYIGFYRYFGSGRTANTPMLDQRFDQIGDMDTAWNSLLGNLNPDQGTAEGPGLKQLLFDLLARILNVIASLFNGSDQDTAIPEWPGTAVPAISRSPGSGGTSSVSGSAASFKGSFDPGNSGFSKVAPPPGKPLSQAESDTLAAKTMTSLMKDLKLTPAQAAGVVGNLKQESGMNPHINEIGSGGQTYGAPNGSQAGYGWAQWTGGRKTAYLNYARAHHLDPGSPAANYGFLVHELKTTESAALASLRRASSPEQAALAFRRDFERAGVPNDHGRMTSAENLYAAYKNRYLA